MALITNNIRTWQYNKGFLDFGIFLSWPFRDCACNSAPIQIDPWVTFKTPETFLKLRWTLQITACCCDANCLSFLSTIIRGSFKIAVTMKKWSLSSLFKVLAIASIPMVAWLWFRYLAISLHLGYLQFLMATWSPFVTYSADFPQAKLMRNLAEKVKNHC